MLLILLIQARLRSNFEPDNFLDAPLPLYLGIILVSGIEVLDRFIRLQLLKFLSSGQSNGVIFPV